jgi:hypothetical protein
VLPCSSSEKFRKRADRRQSRRRRDAHQDRSPKFKFTDSLIEFHDATIQLLPALLRNGDFDFADFLPKRAHLCQNFCNV